MKGGHQMQHDPKANHTVITQMQKCFRYIFK